MKRLIASVMVCAGLCSQAAVAQEQELAPGYNQCMKKATTDFDMAECLAAASQYWDKQITANLLAYNKYCDGSGDANKCKADMKKAIDSWKIYRDTMSTVMYGTMGTINKVMAEEFIATENKKLAIILKALSQE